MTLRPPIIEMLRRLRREDGLTIVEVLVATVVLALVLGGLSQVVMSSASVEQTSAVREHQSSLAEQAIETETSCLEASSQPATQCVDSTKTSTDGALTYTVTTSHTPVYDSNKSVSYYMVTVKVSQSTYGNVQATVLNSRATPTDAAQGTIEVQACAIGNQEDDRMTIASCPDPSTSASSWRQMQPPAGWSPQDPKACDSVKVGLSGFVSNVSCRTVESCNSIPCETWTCANVFLPTSDCQPEVDSDDFDADSVSPYYVPPKPTYEEVQVYPIAVQFQLRRVDGNACILPSQMVCSGTTKTDGSFATVAGLVPGLYQITYSGAASNLVSWAGHSIPSSGDVNVRASATTQAVALYKPDPTTFKGSLTVGFHELSRTAWWAIDWKPGIPSGGTEAFCATPVPLPGRVPTPEVRADSRPSPAAADGMDFDWKCVYPPSNGGGITWTWNDLAPGLYEPYVYYAAIEDSGAGEWYASIDTRSIQGSSGYVWVDPTNVNNDQPAPSSTKQGWVDYVACWDTAGLGRQGVFQRYGWMNQYFHYAPGDIPPNSAGGVTSTSTLDSLWNKYEDGTPPSDQNPILTCGGRTWDTTSGGGGGT